MLSNWFTVACQVLTWLTYCNFHERQESRQLELNLRRDVYVSYNCYGIWAHLFQLKDEGNNNS